MTKFSGRSSEFVPSCFNTEQTINLGRERKQNHVHHLIHQQRQNYNTLKKKSRQHNKCLLKKAKCDHMGNSMPLSLQACRKRQVGSLKKITQNLTTHILFNCLFVIQNTIWSCDYNITPLHGERERQVIR